MTDAHASAATLEREANRLRAEIGMKAAALSDNLRPQSLKAEVSQALHLREMTPTRLLESGAARHPLAIVLCGVAAGYLIQASLKHRGAPTIERDGSLSPPAYQPGILARLSETAQDAATAGIEAVRRHANDLSDDLAARAKDQMTSASAHLDTAMNDNIDTLLSRFPGTAAAQPLVSALAKLALAFALKAGATRTG